MTTGGEGESVPADVDSFSPFYERLPDLFPIPFIFKLLFSLLLGFAFLGPHYWAVDSEVIKDLSWLLCLIIVTAMSCLYYATHVFRTMFPQMDLKVPTTPSGNPDRSYMTKVRAYLSDRHFFWFGFTFAVLNCLVGLGLGARSGESWPDLTLFLGFFIAGFVCGMAVGGIRGVVIALSEFLGNTPKVDYTNPDGCGGLLFLGRALIIFSGVTLVVGVMISLYILNAPWRLREASVVPHIIMWLWIAWPFVLSLTVLLAPASRANRALLNHKIETEVELAISLNRVRTEIAQPELDVAKRNQLITEIEYFGELRAQLHAMRVWPFNAQANVQFLILFVSNAYVAIESVRGLLGSGSSFLVPRW